MIKLKSAVVFTVIVCMTGSFHKAVNAQINLGGYCYTCAYNPMYPRLNRNNDASQVDSLFNKAFAEGERGNYKAEVQIYSEIIRIDPQSAYAYYDIGQVKKNKLNDRAGAIEAFQIAAELFRRQGENSMYKDAIGKVQALRGF